MLLPTSTRSLVANVANQLIDLREDPLLHQQVQRFAEALVRSVDRLTNLLLDKVEFLNGSHSPSSVFQLIRYSFLKGTTFDVKAHLESIGRTGKVADFGSNFLQALHRKTQKRRSGGLLLENAPWPTKAYLKEQTERRKFLIRYGLSLNDGQEATQSGIK